MTDVWRIFICLFLVMFGYWVVLFKNTAVRLFRLHIALRLYTQTDCERTGRNVQVLNARHRGLY